MYVCMFVTASSYIQKHHINSTGNSLKLQFNLALKKWSKAVNFDECFESLESFMYEKEYYQYFSKVMNLNDWAYV